MHKVLRIIARAGDEASPAIFHGSVRMKREALEAEATKWGLARAAQLSGNEPDWLRDRDDFLNKIDRLPEKLANGPSVDEIATNIETLIKARHPLAKQVLRAIDLAAIIELL